MTDTYKAALIEEYESYKRGGFTDRAEHVAQVLQEQFGHEVGKKRQPAKRAPEKADQKAPEEAVPPKPVRSGD